MKLKPQRFFLEPWERSDSYIRISVDSDSGMVDLKLCDCDRRIWWHFGKPGDKRGIAKIRKVKAAIDQIHDYITKADGKDG